MAAITYKDLVKKYAGKAPEVYRAVAIAGGFGLSVSRPDLDIDGASEKQQAAIKKALSDFGGKK